MNWTKKQKAEFEYKYRAELNSSFAKKLWDCGRDHEAVKFVIKHSPIIKNAKLKLDYCK